MVDGVIRGSAGGRSEGWGHWLLVAAVGLAAFAYGLIFKDLGIVLNEEGQILAEAQAILAGKVLYRDIDGFVAPGVWYLTAGVLKIAGADLNATRFLMVLLFSATAVLMFSLCLQFASRGYALGAVIVLFALKALSFPLGNFVFYTEFSLFFALMTIYALVRRGGDSADKWLLVAGLSASLALLFKQNIGGAAVLVVAAYVLARHRRWEAIAWAALAPALLLVGTLLAFIWVGAGPSIFDSLLVVPLTGFYTHFSTPYLGAFAWTDNLGELFLYLPALYSEEFLFRKTESLEDVAYLLARAVSLGVYLAPLILTTVVAVRTVRRRRIEDTEILLLLGGLTTFVGAFPRSDFPHVVQGLVGFIPLAAYLAYSTRSQKWVPILCGTSLAAVSGFCAMLIAGIPYDHEFVHSRARLELAEGTHRIVSTTLGWLDEVVPREEKVSIIPANPMFYFLADRPIPTRYTLMLAHNVGMDGGGQAAKALDEGGVEWIVYSDIRFPGVPSLESYAPILHGYLRTHFERVLPVQGSDPSGTELLHRKSDKRRREPSVRKTDSG